MSMSFERFHSGQATVLFRSVLNLLAALTIFVLHGCNHEGLSTSVQFHAVIRTNIAGKCAVFARLKNASRNNFNHHFVARVVSDHV